MSEVYPRNGVFYAEVYVYDEKHDRYERVRRSTRVRVRGVESERLARLEAGKIERRLSSGLDRRKGETLKTAFLKRAEALRVRSAPKATRKRSLYSAEHLFELLGPDTELSALGPADLLTYASRRLEAGATHDTVRRELSDLGAAYTAVGAVCPRKPELPKPRVIERWLSAPECRALLEKAPPKRARVIMLVLQTALRKGEVWRLVRIGPGVGRLLSSDGGLKTGPRTIPLTSTAEAILLAGPLEKWTNQGRDLKAYAKEAGLGRVTWNDLRSTPATLMLLDDIAPTRIAALLGHKSLRMTERRYARLKSLKVTVEDLSALSQMCAESPTSSASSDALAPPKSE